MASAATQVNERLDKTRQGALWYTTATAVGGSATTMLDQIDVSLYNRLSIQIYNSDGSVVGVAKVWGSLKDDPGTEGGSDWTQLGDDISVGTSSNALKVLSTTPMRWLSINATGNGADLLVYVYAQQV